jgi:alkylhydroperoxidase/carboxymuconolactone decarboxylase family protein YurZ
VQFHGTSPAGASSRFDADMGDHRSSFIRESCHKLHQISYPKLAESEFLPYCLTDCCDVSTGMTSNEGSFPDALEMTPDGRKHMADKVTVREDISTASERRRRVQEAVIGCHPPLAAEFPEALKPLTDWAEAAVWDVWGDPTLPIRDRCLITVSVLAATGRMDQLEVHFGAALRNGWSAKQLGALINHLAVYAGVPAAAAAVPVLNRVLVGRRAAPR